MWRAKTKNLSYIFFIPSHNNAVLQTYGFLFFPKPQHKLYHLSGNFCSKEMVRPSTVTAIPLTRNISFRTNVSENCEPNRIHIIWSLLQFHRHGHIKTWTNYQSQIVLSNKIKTFLMKAPLVSTTFVWWTLKSLVNSSLKPCFLWDQVYLWKYWHSMQSFLIQMAVMLVTCQIHYIITYFQ